MATEEQEIRDTFIKLGEEWDVSPELMDRLKTLTSRLYAPKSTTTVVNDLRYQIFCFKKGEVRGKPPATPLQGLSSEACTKSKLSDSNMETVFASGPKNTITSG